MSERWRPVPNFPGYEVSDHGRVRSFHKRVKGTGSPWEIADTPQRYLKGAYKATGYRFVALCQRGIRYTKHVHRLVARAFLGACPKGKEVCHNDGDKMNNHAENLRYDSHHNNIQDAIDHDTGIGLGACLFTDAEALEIRESYAKSPRPFTEMAQEWECAPTVIARIVHGETYSRPAGPTFDRVQHQHCLTKDLVYQLRNEHRDGASYSELTRRYGVNVGHLSRIINNKVWKDPDYTPPQLIGKGRGHTYQRELALAPADRPGSFVTAQIPQGG